MGQKRKGRTKSKKDLLSALTGAQASVQPLPCPVLLHQRNSLLHRQRPFKKFVRNAISTSFCPTTRSRSAILFSYPLTSSFPPNTSGPRSQELPLPGGERNRMDPVRPRRFRLHPMALGAQRLQDHLELERLPAAGRPDCTEFRCPSSHISSRQGGYTRPPVVSCLGGSALAAHLRAPAHPSPWCHTTATRGGVSLLAYVLSSPGFKVKF